MFAVSRTQQIIIDRQRQVRRDSDSISSEGTGSC